MYNTIVWFYYLLHVGTCGKCITMYKHKLQNGMTRVW